MSNDAKKIGLMGCGMVADYGHFPAIQVTKGLDLYAIYDPEEAALERMQGKYDVPRIFRDVEEFLSSGIEAVTITSPAPYHKQNVLAAARHKLHVLCEKPLAMNGAEAAEMIAATEAAGVSLYTAFCYRFNPSALKIRELVRDKAIGEVRSLRLIYNWGLHGKYTIDGDGMQIIQQRREGRMLEGGPMVDCGTHQIDLAMFWLDSDVVDFSARGAWVDDYDAPDHLWLHMDHANGAHTLVEMSYSYHHTTKNRHSEFVYELIGTEGVIRYDRRDRSFTMETADGTTEFEFHPEKSFPGMYAEWARALQTGHSDLLTSAAAGMRVADIARRGTEEAMSLRNKPGA